MAHVSWSYCKTDVSLPVPFLWLSSGSLPLHPLPAGNVCLCWSWSSLLCGGGRASAVQFWSMHCEDQENTNVWNWQKLSKSILDMKKTIGRKGHHHPLLHTHWSSVPKNFTKWHFFPRGFFRSLGGLTTWCVQIQYWHHWSIHNRYITQVIKSKRDRTLIKVVTAYLPRPWWVASKFSPASKTHTTLSAYSPWPTHVTTR